MTRTILEAAVTDIRHAVLDVKLKKMGLLCVCVCVRDRPSDMDSN